MTVNYINAEGFGRQDIVDTPEARNERDHALIIENVTNREDNTPRRILVEIRHGEIVGVTTESPTIPTPFGDEYGLQTIHTPRTGNKETIEATLYGRLVSVPVAIGYPQLTTLGTNGGYFSPRLIRDFRQYPHRDGSRYTAEAKRYDPRHARFFDREDFNILNESVVWYDDHGVYGSAWHAWGMMYIEFYNENDERQINPLYKDMETPPEQGWGHWIASDYSRAPANTGASALAQLREIHPGMQYLESPSYNGLRTYLGLPTGWRARIPAMTVNGLEGSKIDGRPLSNHPFYIYNLSAWGDFNIVNVEGRNEANNTEIVEHLAVYPSRHYQVAAYEDGPNKQVTLIETEASEQVFDLDIAVEDFTFDPNLPFEIAAVVKVTLPMESRWGLHEAHWVTEGEGGLEVLSNAYAFRGLYRDNPSDTGLFQSVWRNAQPMNIKRSVFENRVTLEEDLGELRFAPFSKGDSITELNTPYNTRPMAGKLRLKFKAIQYREEVKFTYGLENEVFTKLKELKPWLPLVDIGTQVVLYSDATGEIYDPAENEDLQIHLNWLFDWRREIPLSQMHIGSDLVKSAIALKDAMSNEQWGMSPYVAYLEHEENGVKNILDHINLGEYLNARLDASGDSISPVNTLSLHKRACFPSGSFRTSFNVYNVANQVGEDRLQEYRLQADNFGDWTSESIQMQPLVVGKLWENVTLNNPNAKLRLSFFFPLDNSTPDLHSSGAAIEFDIASKDQIATELANFLDGAIHACSYDADLDQLTIGGFNIPTFNFGIAVIDSPAHVQHLVLDPEWAIGPMLQGEYQGFSNETKSFVKSHKTVFHLWHPTPEAVGKFYEEPAVLPVSIAVLDEVRNDELKDAMDLLSSSDSGAVEVSFTQPVGSDIDFDIIHSAIMPSRVHIAELQKEGNGNNAFLDRGLAPGMDLIINDPATLKLLLGETTNPEELMGTFTFNNPTGTSAVDVKFKDILFKEVNEQVVSAHIAFPLINQYRLNEAYVTFFHFQMVTLGLKNFQPLNFTVNASCDIPVDLVPITKESGEGFKLGKVWEAIQLLSYTQLKLDQEASYSSTSKSHGSNPEYVLENEAKGGISETVGIDWVWSEEGKDQIRRIKATGGIDRKTGTIINAWFQGARLADFGELDTIPGYKVTEFAEGTLVTMLFDVLTLPVVELNFPLFAWKFKTANQVTFTRQLDTTGLPPEIIGGGARFTFNMKATTREEMATVGSNRQSFFSLYPTRYSDDLYYKEPSMSAGKVPGDDMQVYVVMEYPVVWTANYRYEKLVNRSYNGQTIEPVGTFTDVVDTDYNYMGMDRFFAPFDSIATNYQMTFADKLVTASVPLVTGLCRDDVYDFGLNRMGLRVAPYAIKFTDEAIVADLKRFATKGFHTSQVGTLTTSNGVEPYVIYNDLVRISEDRLSAWILVPIVQSTMNMSEEVQDIACKLELNSLDGVIYTPMEWVTKLTVRVPEMIQTDPTEINVYNLRLDRQISGALFVSEVPMGPETHYQNFNFSGKWDLAIPLGDTGTQITIQEDILKLTKVGTQAKALYYYIYLTNVNMDEINKAALVAAGWNVQTYIEGSVIYGVLKADGEA